MTGCRWAIRIGWSNGSIFHYVSMYVSTDEAQAWTLRIHLILACRESGVATCPPHVHHGGALIEGVSDLERLGPQAISALLCSLGNVYPPERRPVDNFAW